MNAFLREMKPMRPPSRPLPDETCLTVGKLGTIRVQQGEAKASTRDDAVRLCDHYDRVRALYEALSIPLKHWPNAFEMIVWWKRKKLWGSEPVSRRKHGSR